MGGAVYTGQNWPSLATLSRPRAALGEEGGGGGGGGGCGGFGVQLEMRGTCAMEGVGRDSPSRGAYTWPPPSAVAGAYTSNVRKYIPMQVISSEGRGWLFLCLGYA